MPCANAGAGEYVDFHGQILITVILRGTYSITENIEQTMAGVGETTGDIYKGAAMNVLTGTLSQTNNTFTFLQNITLHDSQNQTFRLHFNTTAKVNIVTGQFTLYVDNFYEDCK